MQTLIKHLSGILSANHGAKTEERPDCDVNQSKILKKLGPGEAVMVKSGRVAEIYNMYGMNRPDRP